MYRIRFIYSLAAQREQFLRTKADQIAQYQRALSAQVNNFYVTILPISLRIPKWSKVWWNHSILPRKQSLAYFHLLYFQHVHFR